MTRRTIVQLIAASASLLLLLAGCASSGPGQDQPADAPSEAFGHVHGLGVDPADGTIYVATHHGLFRANADRRLEPVGTSKRDLMGFTITGPRTFLSSGHPSPDENAPNPLGVIRSRDAGATWDTLGLAGEVDMHALDVSGTTVYGYDSSQGQLRVSTDGGQTWQVRASMDALDIAVHPEDPNIVLATTADGVTASRDGGAVFTPGTGTVLAYLSWPAADALYGVTPEGALQRSSDQGNTWAAVGSIPGGQPQALTAVDANRILAATMGGVFESQDGGRTFHPLAGASS